MLIFVTGCLCYFFILLYFIRLFADGRKLRSKLLSQLRASGDAASFEERLLFSPPYEEYLELRFYSEASNSFGEQPPAA